MSNVQTEKFLESQAEADLERQPKTVPVKYHSPLVSEFPLKLQVQIEKELFEEIREDRV